MNTLYERLQVDPKATAYEIRKSYRKLSLMYHPDKNDGKPEAEEMFKNINEAYAVLNDVQKRAKYDELLLEQTRRHEQEQRGYGSSLPQSLRSTEAIIKALFTHFGFSSGYKFSYTVNHDTDTEEEQEGTQTDDDDDDNDEEQSEENGDGNDHDDHDKNKNQAESESKHHSNTNTHPQTQQETNKEQTPSQSNNQSHSHEKAHQKEQEPNKSKQDQPSDKTRTGSASESSTKQIPRRVDHHSSKSSSLSSKQQQIAKKNDIFLALELPLADFYCGTRKQIQYSRRELCIHCKGNGLKPGAQVLSCFDCEGKGYWEETMRREVGLGLLSISRTERRRCKTCCGNKRLIHQRDVCTECNQSGYQLRQHSIDIRVQPGASLNKRLVFAGQGHRQYQDTSPKTPLQGDLVVMLTDRAGNNNTDSSNSRHIHADVTEQTTATPVDNTSHGIPLEFERIHGRPGDLLAPLQISLSDAMLGFVLHFMHLNQQLWTVQVLPLELRMLELPLVRIIGAGMPEKQASFGDLYLELHPQFPTRDQLKKVFSGNVHNVNINGENQQQLQPSQLLSTWFPKLVPSSLGPIDSSSSVLIAELPESDVREQIMTRQQQQRRQQQHRPKK